MNAVHLEMIKLGKKWQQELKRNPEAISFVLLGQKPENQLFETYFKYQLSDEAKTNDVYLLYYQPFDNAASYSESLIQELKFVYKQWQKENDNSAEWKVESITSSVQFIDSILQFRSLYPQLNSSRIFIHLAPTSIEDAKAFELWALECGKRIEQTAATDSIKLVFTDHQNYRVIKNFYKPHFWEFPIDISQLMEKTAEGTNQRKGAKENSFQQLILKAGNYLGKQQFADADIILNQAIKTAADNKYFQGTVMARLLKAQNFQAQGKNIEARTFYEQAKGDAKHDPDLFIQVCFAFGSFLLSQKEKNEALHTFSEVLPIAEQKNDLVLQIELNRLIGQLNDSKLFPNKAILSFEKCIEIGKNVPKNELPETSLPYIGTLLLKKYGEQSEKGKILEATMVSLFGPEWKKLVHIPEMKKNKLVD